METFALYLVKSVVWLSGFALVFFLFLRNERFFFLKRIYLIAGILASFVCPLITIHYSVILSPAAGIPADSVIAKGVVMSNNLFSSPAVILSGIYILGVIIMLGSMIAQGRIVLRAIRKSGIITLHPAKLVKSNDYTTSFSFFSYVFVNPSISELEAKEIMIHELVHVRQKHWFDLLFVELLRTMQWFNPVVWIYVSFIRQNHEYLADEAALQQTSDPAVYRAVLLNQIAGSPVISLVNSFNYSINKKRFKMMKNIITSPYRKMKILLILPVFVIVLYAFARPEFRYAGESPGPVISNTSLQKEVKGIVRQTDGQPLPGASVVLRGTTIGASADSKGSFRFSNVPEDGEIVVSFVGYKSKVIKPEFNSDMIITLVQDTVKYMNSVKMLIPPPPPPPPPVGEVKGGGLPGPPPPPPPPPPVNGIEGPPPLYVIDGVIEKNGMSKVDMNDVSSMNVLSDEVAEKKYGEKGKNGVIELTTFKKGEKRQENQSDKDAFVVVEGLPEFPGGPDAMKAWIAANIKYPVEAAKEKITGIVMVNFLVTASGKIEDVKVTRSVNPMLDEVAKEAVSRMPDWKPGTQAGKRVAVQMQIPVYFNLKK